ncbi:unnamed protein product [[Candida] boidinii]|uniref:Unnamed protein product n=1 Tax=Candida boidinii TaxID=5477 RepID=A0A9W6T047_CANBO|nr:hypothetical protein B5S30_g5437 [[Candida] boidinii]OWB86228.1 hypothetical protein B5S33_g4912 [[Candida] boidinii]GME71828.1 unnamed protein product [[Candida] boidinii]GMF97788.1 unnamed protein product [[Candida] boidinii]
MSFVLPPCSKLNDYSYKEIESILNNLFEPCESLTSFLIPLLYPLPNSATTSASTSSSTNASSTSFSSPSAPFKSSSKTYHDYKNLIENCRFHLTQLINDLNKSKDLNDGGLSYNSLNNLLNEIISAHPRLGPPKPQPQASQTQQTQQTTTTHKSPVPEDLSDHSKNEQKSLNSGNPELAQRLIELNAKYEETFPGLRFVVFVNGQSREKIIEKMINRINRNNINLERFEAIDAMCDIALDRAKKLGAKL